MTLLFDKLPHALLFDSETPALALARELLGNKFMDDLSHPDLIIKDASKIDDIREISLKLNQTAHQGGYKVVILKSAELMPLAAINALLKTLEEPPDGSIIMLVTKLGLLPATLRSRCQKINNNSIKNNGINKNNTIIQENHKNLLQLLKKLQLKQINPSEAALLYEKTDLREILDGLYYCAALLIQKYPVDIFAWLDHINIAREKVLRKYNPNTLLTLETLFYYWTLYDARGFALPSG